MLFEWLRYRSRVLLSADTLRRCSHSQYWARVKGELETQSRCLNEDTKNSTIQDICYSRDHEWVLLSSTEPIITHGLLTDGQYPKLIYSKRLKDWGLRNEDLNKDEFTKCTTRSPSLWSVIKAYRVPVPIFVQVPSVSGSLSQSLLTDYSWLWFCTGKVSYPSISSCLLTSRQVKLGNGTRTETQYGFPGSQIVL